MSIKTTYIFLLCIYFFSMNYSCDEIYFLLIYQKSTSLSQYCSKKNDNKKFYSFQFNIEDFSISQYFFYYLIKFKNCSIGTCILILLLKYNRISLNSDNFQSYSGNPLEHLKSGILIMTLWLKCWGTINLYSFI